MEPLTRDDPAEIGGYRLRARLGAGGMGRVYLASTPGGRRVALKVVRPELGDDADFRARFRQEIEAAQRVRGLYTAELLNADPAATPPWLVTAYVPGPSLQQAVADHGPMPPETVILLMAGVAEALQAIHSAGVVHRDLKPSNVLLAPDGPRVIDFGIARAAEATNLTQSGMAVGSPQFMAPEQIRGLAITPAIDVFALGAVAAFALLGLPPFGEGQVAALMYRVLNEPPRLTGCSGAAAHADRALPGQGAGRPPHARRDHRVLPVPVLGEPGRVHRLLAAAGRGRRGPRARDGGRSRQSPAGWPVPPGDGARPRTAPAPNGRTARRERRRARTAPARAGRAPRDPKAPGARPRPRFAPGRPSRGRGTQHPAGPRRR